MRTFLCAVIIALTVAYLYKPGPQPAPACPPQVVHNPLWSHNPRNVGGYVGDRRTLTNEERLAVLEAQLQDPYRYPPGDGELRLEIARLKREMRKK